MPAEVFTPKPPAKSFGQRLRENFGLPPSKKDCEMQIEAFLRANSKPKNAGSSITTTSNPREKSIATPFRNGLNMVKRERNH